VPLRFLASWRRNPTFRFLSSSVQIGAGISSVAAALPVSFGSADGTFPPSSDSRPSFLLPGPSAAGVSNMPASDFIVSRKFLILKFLPLTVRTALPPLRLNRSCEYAEKRFSVTEVTVPSGMISG